MPLTHLRPLLDDLLDRTTPAVLATLVEAQGSTYRKPGARMLLHPDEGSRGVISAGCMEMDLAERVHGVLERDRPELARYDMGSEFDLIWGTGMGCQGKAAVLLQPVCHAQSPVSWAERARQALRERRSGVLLTCYASDVPGRLGAVTWWDDAAPHPHLQPSLQEEARRVLASDRCQTLQLGGDLMLAEPVIPPPALWIFGAGEPARPLAALAVSLGWDVGILDHRPALATEERFSGARWVVCDTPEALAAHVPLTPRTAAVVMSHHYEADLAALRVLLPSGLAYVGLQGNRKRTEKLLGVLAEESVPVPTANFHAPMGLDLGAESPEAIALSVLAEIHAVLHGRSAQPLRAGAGPIHP